MATLAVHNPAQPEAIPLHPGRTAAWHLPQLSTQAAHRGARGACRAHQSRSPCCGARGHELGCLSAAVHTVAASRVAALRQVSKEAEWHSLLKCSLSTHSIKPHSPQHEVAQQLIVGHT